MARLSATPALLNRYLEILALFGFRPDKVQFAPDGSIILHAGAGEDIVQHDPLTEWELKRDPSIH